MAREKKTEKAEKAEKRPPAKAGQKRAPAKTAAKKAPAKSTKKAAPKAPKAEPAAPVARGPFAKVKAVYGSKDDLVKKIVEPLAAADEDTEALGDRLRKASNQQLLRLAKVVETVKAKYGSREKLIQSLGTLVGKAKDQDFIAKLGTFSLPKLLDLARSYEKRARA